MNSRSNAGSKLESATSALATLESAATATLATLESLLIDEGNRCLKILQKTERALDDCISPEDENVQTVVKIGSTPEARLIRENMGCQVRAGAGDFA